MRVISQSGLTDVPYEQFVFAITKDNYICCTKAKSCTPDEVLASIVAKYSSQEKALKAMGMLRETYLGVSRQENIARIFVFPQDSEV